MSESPPPSSATPAAKPLGGQPPSFAMYLATFEVENFRAIKKATFRFRPGLNVIIGENNSAKSAVIDALRIILALGTFERKDDYIRIRATDLHSGDLGGGEHPPTQSIRLAATFVAPPGTDLDGQFYELLSPVDSSADTSVFKLAYLAQFRYHAAKGSYTYAGADIRGGAGFENPVSSELLDGMRAIYLAPLRDLLNDRTRVGTEVERLIVGYTESGKEAELAEIPRKVRDYTLELIAAVTGNRHHAATSERFAAYAKPYQISDQSLSFTPWGISEGLLRTMLPVFSHMLHGEGADRLPLSSNGLGLNQLIYASIVLSRQGPADTGGEVVRFFAIEEPEAHLHPQLQDSFFHALNTLSDHQVFVTSHSPSITAKADIERISVMRKGTAESGIAVHELSEAFSDRDTDKRYLHRFLDVTRSQLLFARGAIFVEGVTEAMLVQQFSELLDLSLRDHGIEVVVVDAAHGFEHFKPLFSPGSPLTRGVLVGDSDVDPATVLDSLPLTGVLLGQYDEPLAVDQGGVTAAAVGYGTFEFGLLLASTSGSGNLMMQKLLHSALKRAAEPLIGAANVEAFCVNFDRPASTYRKMKKKRAASSAEVSDVDWVGSWRTNSYWRKTKADFAFHLSEGIRLVDDTTRSSCITVPRYIEDAIRFLVGPDKGR